MNNTENTPAAETAQAPGSVPLVQQDHYCRTCKENKVWWMVRQTVDGPQCPMCWEPVKPVKKKRQKL